MIEYIFLFAYFLGGGNSGMHLAWSEDGLQWNELMNDSAVITPAEGLMRDPFLFWSEKEQQYHLIWTTEWKSETIGHATSKDLLNWGKQEKIPVMTNISGVQNCWAPEMVYDDKTETYVLFWASTVTGLFEETAGTSEEKYNHRMWFTETKDFRSFTPAKIFYDPGFSIIDSTMVQSDDTYYLITKDERLVPEKKHLFVSTASSPKGPWSAPGPAISDSWVEGPTTLVKDHNTLVFFDRYRIKKYGAIQSSDFIKWTDISERISMPEGARHGNIIRVKKEQIEALIHPDR
jgi:hypothetical protein